MVCGKLAHMTGSNSQCFLRKLSLGDQKRAIAQVDICRSSVLPVAQEAVAARGRSFPVPLPHAGLEDYARSRSIPASKLLPVPFNHVVVDS